MLAVLIAAGLAASNDSTVITPSLVNFVCAPKGMNFWIADAGRFAAKPIRAAFTGPLNAESSIHVVQHGSPIGVAPAAAVTFKWHF
jgi:hypothetical protein